MNNKTPRNAACPCGSGKKFKNCCLNGNKTPVASIRVGFAIAVIATDIGLGTAFYLNANDRDKEIPDNIARTANTENIPSDILLKTSQIEQYDFAALNLICARGLKGAENLDIRKCLSVIESWGERVRGETERHIQKFFSNPGNFENSEPYFRMLMLVTVLEQDLGIRYNPDLMSKPSLADLRSTSFFRNSADLFLHGLTDSRLGTCASIPVLTVSVGRRLGYPLKLVRGKSHLFVRWDDGKERFNIESGGHGMNSFPDDHYRMWPFPISDSEIKTGFYLKSLTPAEQYAGFLETRGFCLMENGRIAEALNSFNHVNKLVPGHPHLKNYIMKASSLLTGQADKKRG